MRGALWLRCAGFNSVELWPRASHSSRSSDGQKMRRRARVSGVKWGVVRFYAPKMTRSPPRHGAGQDGRHRSGWAAQARMRRHLFSYAKARGQRYRRSIVMVGSSGRLPPSPGSNATIRALPRRYSLRRHDWTRMSLVESTSASTSLLFSGRGSAIVGLPTSSGAAAMKPGFERSPNARRRRGFRRAPFFSLTAIRPVVPDWTDLSINPATRYIRVH